MNAERQLALFDRVSEAPEILSRWVQASVLARSRMTCVLDVAATAIR